MPSTVVLAPTVSSRSSLELMLDLIQKRDEQPKDEPPALPARPTSRGRLPSSRRSLPLNFRIGSIAPEPVSKSPKEGADKEIAPENSASGNNNVVKSDHLEDHPFVNIPELESYEGVMEDVSVMDSATVNNLGCDHNVDNLLKKIVKSEDAKHQGLHHIIGVQKYIRGVQTRRHYEELKRGVTMLQSFIRGERARREFELVLKRWGAVLVIQKFLKGWIARRTFSNHKQRIIHIQSAARGWRTRKQLIILKNLKLSELNQTNTNRSIQEIKDSNMGHLWVRRSVVEELEMRVLKAEALLTQKEEDHAMFQHRFEQYEAKMKSMEEMWQKQLMSLQWNPSKKHSEAHQVISTETQRQSLNAEVALREKEEENAKLREQLQQYEMRWSEYDIKMKSMEEMWQKQMASLQLSLAAARKSLVADDLVSPPERPSSPLLCPLYDSESTLSVEARSPEPALAKQPQLSIGMGGNPNDTQNEVSLLVKEFEQHKQVFEESTRFLVAAKSQQPNSCMNPDEDLRRLKIQFSSWEKDYKIRLREAKSALKKLGNPRSEKPRKKWWFRGSA
ncbi:P-loop containing nucleoside triphosphate hydrolase protein [Dioscorea alata]|uniref:P-loop containing nucleoside triphosphate hydrolase protein n=1 Tax=Dioscorea alata TaxID=55571 RepID=A0ACB7UPK9_DIOAL|nr:P-loop containing nucleoside triphosphate hydrolase protein [Dioscorea alata]